MNEWKENPYEIPSTVPDRHYSHFFIISILLENWSSGLDEVRVPCEPCFDFNGSICKRKLGAPKREPEGVKNLLRERGNGKCVSLVVTTGLKMVSLSRG